MFENFTFWTIWRRDKLDPSQKCHSINVSITTSCISELSMNYPSNIEVMFVCGDCVGKYQGLRLPPFSILLFKLSPLATLVHAPPVSSIFNPNPPSPLPPSPPTSPRLLSPPSLRPSSPTSSFSSSLPPTLRPKHRKKQWRKELE